VIPAPGGPTETVDEDATRPLYASGPAVTPSVPAATESPAAETPEPADSSVETPSGLPSRAARGSVPGEQSLLDGPSFDGFAVPGPSGHEDIRPGQDEETEAFHPGRQAPVPTRPRHAAPGDPAGSAEGDGDGDEAPRGRFQPMAPQPPAEATTVLSTRPDGTFKPAPAFGVTGSGPVVTDAESEATTRFQAPLADPEETANFGFGAGTPGGGAPDATDASDGAADPDATRPLDAQPPREGPSNSPWAQPPRDRT
jgi:integrin beta 3